MNVRTDVRPIDDLRSYIAAVEAHGQLHRVKTEVDWKFELCHVSKVNEEQKGPALLYENVKGYDIPVFTSAFTTPQRLAIALEQDPSLSMSNLSKKWMQLTTKKMVKPEYVDNPAVMDNVLEGDKVDINMFPSPWFYPDDGGRFFDPYSNRQRYAAETLAACGVYFDRPEWIRESRDTESIAVWWFGPRALAAAPAADHPRDFHGYRVVHSDVVRDRDDGALYAADAVQRAARDADVAQLLAGNDRHVARHIDDVVVGAEDRLERSRRR